MSTRIIEIGSNGKHLSVYRGSLKISEDGREVARVPLDDICSVVVAGFGITYSNDLIVRLAAHNIWLVACGTNYQPAAIYTRRLKRKHRGYGDTFYIDEVFVRINGKQHYLWRAVDQDGDVVAQWSV